MAETDCVDCPVCITAYNKTKLLRPVTCPHCGYHVCNRCMRQYMTSTMQEPHCMKCRKGWNPEFVQSQFPKTFMSFEYRHHREKLLMERQKAMLTETMPYVDLEDRRRLRQKALADLYLERRVIAQKIHLIHALETRDRVDDPVDATDLADIMEERHHSVRLARGLEALPPDVVSDDGSESASPEKKTRVYRVQPCPAECCNGFLNPQYQCMKCTMWSCRDCLQVLGAEADKGENKAHVCDPAQVESVRLIRNQYRACPKCGVMIEKSMGCSQIWCTQCHTAFDYHTGKIETQIHNPHYYEWLRRTQGARGAEGDQGAEADECRRAQQMNPWERMNDAATIQRRMRRYTDLEDADRATILSGHRLATHMFRHAEHLRAELRDEEPERKLRISFLRGAIWEGKWRAQLLRMDRQKTKFNHYLQLMTMFYETMYDQIDAMIAETAKRTLQNVVALVEYYREQYDILSKTYGRYEAVAISEAWRE